MQIIQTHHAFLRQQLLIVDRLLDQVVTAHLDRHPELARLQQIFVDFTFEIRRHMAKEEQVLFPAIIRLEQQGRCSPFPFGSIRRPIDAMERDHAVADDELERMRELTGGFNPPADACTAYQDLLAALLEIEKDMQVHVHLENDVLFPAAIRLEEEVMRSLDRPVDSTALSTV